MPLVRVTLHKGKNQDYLNAVSAAIYQSLVEKYEMPENDLFQIFEQVEPGSFFYDKTYPAGKEHRSADFMMIVINCLSLEPAKKRAFFQHLVANLEKAPGVRPADVLIRLDITSDPEDFSFQDGISAAAL
jgi:4-oxalocrotonate tautomerase